MQRQRGFTVIELLCVIAVIVFLIALLTPYIGTTRRGSLTIKCASNLRQLGLANVSYAADNNNWNAPWNEFNGFPLGSNTPASTGYSSPAEALLGINGPQATNATAGGAGRLYFGGYLTNTLLAYCPAQPPGQFQARFDAANNIWRSPNGYTNYEWNPHWRYAVSGEAAPPYDPAANGLQIGAGGQLVAAYETLSSLPGDKCLATDMLYDFQNMSHTNGKDAAQTNVLFGDCHVTTVTLPKPLVAEIIKTPPLWNWPTPGNAAGQIVMASAVVDRPGYPRNWPAPTGRGWAGGLSNYVDVLETLANGNDPTFAGQVFGGMNALAKYPASDPYGMTTQRVEIRFPGQ